MLELSRERRPSLSVAHLILKRLLYSKMGTKLYFSDGKVKQYCCFSLWSALMPSPVMHPIFPSVHPPGYFTRAHQNSTANISFLNTACSLDTKAPGENGTASLCSIRRRFFYTHGLESHEVLLAAAVQIEPLTPEENLQSCLN